MSRQTFLFGFSDLGIVDNNVALSEIRTLTWNISNPSIERVRRQFEWLIETKANVIILTEAKYSRGCAYMRDALEDVGFEVTFPEPVDNDYSVIVATKGFQNEEWNSNNQFLPHRIGTIALNTWLGHLRIAGMYVPSRGPKEVRNVNKKRFQDQIMQWLHVLTENKDTSSLIIGGDLNVIEPDHIPKYSVFGDWEYQFYNAFIKSNLVDAYRALNPGKQEYSWYGRYGDGYRFDHLFVSKRISALIAECYYIHEPRLSGLSDHSAMWLRLTKRDRENP